MNLPTALVLAVVILIAGAIIYKLVKDKKKGKSLLYQQAISFVPLLKRAPKWA